MDERGPYPETQALEDEIDRLNLLIACAPAIDAQLESIEILLKSFKVNPADTNTYYSLSGEDRQFLDRRIGEILQSPLELPAPVITARPFIYIPAKAA